jgi:formylglycine-generating enzyme required for sulfatase activity
LSVAVRLRTASGTREYREDELPLVLGCAPGAAMQLADPSLPQRAAVLGRRQGRFYLQAVPGVDVLALNDEPIVSASAWLAAGDRIKIGADRFTVETAGEVLELAAEGLEEAVTAPPVLIEEAAPLARLPAEGELLKPAEFRRAIRSLQAPPPQRPWKLKAAALAGAALLVAVAAFVFTATPVRIEVTPEPERLAVRGGWLTPALGGRFLLRPGRYTVVARREGYAELVREFDVVAGGVEAFRFALERLPDVYAITSGALAGARVLLDGVEVGATPLERLELAPGLRRLRVEAERHASREIEIEVEGGGRQLALDLALAPDWGELVIASSPAGAQVSAGGSALGETPLVAELGAGRHDIEVAMAGYKPWLGQVVIEAERRVELPEIVLEQADGRLRVASEPAGAAVLVDGDYRGLTPLELQLPPGRAQRIELRRSGFNRAVRTLTLESGADERMLVTLEALPRAAEPAPAPRAADASPAAEPATAPAPTNPERMRTSQGAELVLVQPGRFTMGASRREPGRRPNENLREVELTRAFYIGTTPVTNAQFRAFDPQHQSGEAGRYGLGGERQPVVRVSWSQAVAYCNWLSEQDGLPPAYRRVGEDWRLVEPRTHGYRLPTEAEWAWAARYAGRAAEAPRYPWGAALPPPERSGNYADESARVVLGAVIARYEDGYPVTSPVGSFAPNRLGLFDVGGNVAEWIGDPYGVYPPSDELLVDPSGPSSGRFRVIRGSSWMHHGATELRLSYRDYGDQPRPDLGFRIARDLE